MFILIKYQRGLDTLVEIPLLFYSSFLFFAVPPGEPSVYLATGRKLLHGGVVSVFGWHSCMPYPFRWGCYSSAGCPRSFIWPIPKNTLSIGFMDVRL